MGTEDTNAVSNQTEPTTELPGDAVNESGSILSLKGVCKRFGSLTVLNGVDLEIDRGTVTCVIGPSGSGKSTLLRCVNLLAPPEAGRISLEGKEITGAKNTEGLDFV